MRTGRRRKKKRNVKTKQSGKRKIRHKAEKPNRKGAGGGRMGKKSHRDGGRVGTQGHGGKEEHVNVLREQDNKLAH